MKHLSRQYFERMGEPLGDSVTQRGPDGRITYGSGGGGGSANPDTRYANLDKLYGVQSQASEFMLNNAMPYIPELTTNSATMVDQAMDGTLAKQMSEQAGNNAQQSLGAALDANTRNMQRFGMNFGANRMLSEANRNAIMGAGMKVGEMNKANAAAEDTKWNRNASFYGQVMGMNNGAMQGMSSAGAGMNSMNAQQNANAAANASGAGQAAAAFSNSLFKADGGEITKEELNAPKLASGGNAWEAYKKANPVTLSSGNGSSGSGSNYFGAFVSGAAPALLGHGVKDLLKGSKSEILKAGKEALTKGKDWVSSLNYDSTGAPNGVTYGGDIGADTPIDWSSVSNYGSDVAAEVGSSAATELGSSVAADAGSNLAAEGGSQLAAEGGAQLAGEAGSSMAAEVITAKKGGYIHKHAQGLAMGGMPSMQKMSVSDNSTVAQNDANKSMSMVNMDDIASKPTNAIPAGRDANGGKTTGMGESSYNDPDGFGKEGADNRHFMGSAILSYFLPKGTGGIVADAIHPIMEPITRTLVNTGHSITGSSAGAMVVDPQGTMASGKYSPETIVEDWAKEHGKITAGASVLAGDPITAGIAGKLGGLFSEGGEVEPTQRADYVPGGEVRGPGTETSDDIPAWLSDGEYVLNAEAVKLVGKDKLEEVNQKGLEVREKKKSLLSIGTKRPVKLAGGGFLGGNLGIAMGAGVDQWNRMADRDQRQQAIDLQKEANARQAELAKQHATEFEWKTKDRQRQDELQGRLNEIGQSQSAFDANTALTTSNAIEAAKTQGVLTPDVEAAVKANTAADDAKIRPNFDREYVNAFRDFGKLDQAEAYQKLGRMKEVGAKVSESAEDPTIKAIAPEFPLEAAKLDAMAKNRAAQLAAQLAAQKAIVSARVAAQGNRPAATVKPVKDEELELGRKLISDQFHKDYALNVGAGDKSKVYAGPELAPTAHSFYEDLIANGVRPSVAARKAIQLTKASYDPTQAEFVAKPQISADGVPVVQVFNKAGGVESTLYGKNNGFANGVANPTAFLSGDADKVWSATKQDAVVKRFGSPEKVREFAAMSDADIDVQVALMAKAQKEKTPAMSDADIQQGIQNARKSLANWRILAQEYSSLNPVRENKAKPVVSAEDEYKNAWKEQTTPLGYKIGDTISGIGRALNPFRTGAIEEARARSREGLNTE